MLACYFELQAYHSLIFTQIQFLLAYGKYLQCAAFYPTAFGFKLYSLPLGL